MALYAFDGTGNEDRDGDDRDSNVCDFFKGYQDANRNDDPGKSIGSLYLKGIGTRAKTLVGEGASEAFGIGGHRRVRQMIDRLENNIEHGDPIVDVIGFSRGAALALSFGNEVAKKLPSVTIRFMGLWDVVGEFGAPGRFINAGHDLHFPSNVQRCYHAMALDERRLLFPLTRLGLGRDSTGRLCEVWFRGVHSDVGGGNGNGGLNWIALNWLYHAAVREQLPIDPVAIAANLALKALPQQISDHKVEAGPPRTIFDTDVLHASVMLTPGIAGRPHNNPRVALSRIDDEGHIVEPGQESGVRNQGSGLGQG
jgi:uncharacterized protein (DUF2235 family)